MPELTQEITKHLTASEIREKRASLRVTKRLEEMDETRDVIRSQLDNMASVDDGDENMDMAEFLAGRKNVSMSDFIAELEKDGFAVDGTIVSWAEKDMVRK